LFSGRPASFENNRLQSFGAYTELRGQDFYSHLLGYTWERLFGFAVKWFMKTSISKHLRGTAPVLAAPK